MLNILSSLKKDIIIIIINLIGATYIQASKLSSHAS